MEWVVEEIGSLLEYLYAQYEGSLSKKKIKAQLDKGLCRLNGKVERFCKTPICPGDKITLIEEAPQKDTETLYEDDYFLVLNKARGVECDPKNFPGLELIHRLDRDTAGVLMLAKSPSVKEKMIQLFQKKQVRKRYIATVKGHLKENRGELDTKMSLAYGEGTTRRFKVSEEGKAAITEWEVIEKNKDTTTLYLYPITGRTHQLRVHMAHLGHPILGDVIYGRDAPADHLHLTAESVEFVHPYTQQKVLFSLVG